MEITSKPTELDEIDRAILKMEMEKLSLKNDTDKASKERLAKLENDLGSLKEKQKELTEQWDREKNLMTRIRSTKEEVICCVDPVSGNYAVNSGNIISIVFLPFLHLCRLTGSN